MTRGITELISRIPNEVWAMRPESLYGLLDAARIAIDHPSIVAVDVDVKNDDPGKVEAQVEGDIAVVPIRGVLMRSIPAWYHYALVCTDTARLQECLADLVANPEIRGVMLDVDSPGGGVLGTPDTAAMIAELNDKLPVVTFTGGQMDSGAYYIGCPADSIVATVSAQVGCVGVFSGVLDLSEYYARLGAKVSVFRSGKYKGMGLPGTSLSEAQTEYLQARVEKMGTEFRGWVHEHRAIADEDLEGQEYWGPESVARGFVDIVGDQTAALEELRALIELRG